MSINKGSVFHDREIARIECKTKKPKRKREIRVWINPKRIAT
jgi:hypothetical protein